MQPRLFKETKLKRTFRAVIAVIPLAAFAADEPSPNEHHKHESMGHEGAHVDHADHAQTQQHDMHEMKMQGMFGNYSMTREASGTSWQPDSSPHEGIHGMYGDWMTMTHGFATAIYDHQGG